MLRVSFVTLSIFLFFALVCSANNPYPSSVTTPPSWSKGKAGNGTIYYQTDNYYFFGNVQNPITVSISYSNGYNFPASFCLNSFAQDYPIPGTNLESNCPSGGYGTVSNDTIPNSNSDDAPDGTTDDTTTAEIFVKPAKNLGFVVTIPDADASQNFVIQWKAKQCDDLSLYPVGSNGQCISIETLKNKQVFNLGAGTWRYFTIDVSGYSFQTNNITLSVNGTSNGISMFVQEGYYPTEEWYLNTDNNVDGDITEATILTPGTPQRSDVFFVGIFNSNDGTRQISLNMTSNACSGSNQFGFNCQHVTSNSTAVGGIKPFPATLTAGKSSNTVNNGSSLSFDYSDEQYEHDYAYFQITQLPNYTLPFSIRVSVGNNDVSDLSGAPPIFAKVGAYPSAQSNDYNISTYGDVAHQLVLPITSEDVSDPTGGHNWFIAVQLPADFSIWVGTNCANNCSDGEHGDCMCNDQYCVDTTNNGTVVRPFYQLPTSLSDSSGACSCHKDKYDFSFDCTQKNNGNTALYILLIAIGGLIVLGVAIGVPLYCYISNKKAKKSVMEDDYLE